MSSLFLSVLNMSIRASWMILVVLILRLVLKKAPGWFRMGLWALTAVRLLLPFSFESKLSLLPSDTVVGADILLSNAPQIYSGITQVDAAINPFLSQVFAPAAGDSMNPLQFWIPFTGILWLIGAATMIVYMLVSFYRLRRRVGNAVLEDGCYVSEAVVSPFVLGIRNPKIYLPASITPFEKPHVLAHEQAHIHRKDHWWKPLGFAILSIHWFNPLVWLSYGLFCRDLEYACDESVINALASSQRADYSQVLLNFSAQRSRISACPLAFGEDRIKERVKRTLSYKKPTFWSIAAAIIVITIVAVCLLTNPAKAIPESPLGEDLHNPNYVYAYYGYYGSDVSAVDDTAKEAIISMIYDHKYTLLGEMTLDYAGTRTTEERVQRLQDYLNSLPGGIKLDETDIKTAFHIKFSYYGTYSEQWTFYDSCIQREIIKGRDTVETLWYRQDISLFLQVLNWYENMALSL